MNIQRFKAILDQIKSHPETWNQYVWHSHCGTSHCIAGWAQIHAKKIEDICSADNDARKWLELTYAEARYLFAPYRRMEDFDRILEHGFPKECYEKVTNYSIE